MSVTRRRLTTSRPPVSPAQRQKAGSFNLFTNDNDGQ